MFIISLVIFIIVVKAVANYCDKHHIDLPDSDVPYTPDMWK